MSRAYSEDLRERVLDAVEQGSSARAAAARYGIGAATAVRWVRRWRVTGQRGARCQGFPTRSILDPHETFLFGLVEETPDITLDEMSERLREEKGVCVCRVTVWRFFDRRGWSLKKGQAMRKSRTGLTSTPPGSGGSAASRTLIRRG